MLRPKRGGAALVGPTAIERDRTWNQVRSAPMASTFVALPRRRRGSAGSVSGGSVTVHRTGVDTFRSRDAPWRYARPVAAVEPEVALERNPTESLIWSGPTVALIVKRRDRGRRVWSSVRSGMCSRASSHARLAGSSSRSRSPRWRNQNGWPWCPRRRALPKTDRRRQRCFRVFPCFLLGFLRFRALNPHKEQ